VYNWEVCDLVIDLELGVDGDQWFGLRCGVGIGLGMFYINGWFMVDIIYKVSKRASTPGVIVFRTQGFNCACAIEGSICK
jgi:hypothetical protein